MKRFLDCTASDFEKMSKAELVEAIQASEGRILVCETIGTIMPMLGDVTNAEFVASMGADIILLNIFDVFHPVIQGLPECAPEDVIRKVKELTGRPVGINLEPLEQDVESTVDTIDMWKLSSGRQATLETAKKAVEMGVDFIVLTGNPGIGVTNAAIIDTLKVYRKELGNSVALIAGKMHAAGIISEGGENIITEEDVTAFAEAGADVILMPAPGTVPGITMEYIRKLVCRAHAPFGRCWLRRNVTSRKYFGIRKSNSRNPSYLS